MKWVKLSSHLNGVLNRGALIRFPRLTPAAGESTDFAVYMACESPSPPLRLGLMRIDGYDAGINCYVVFPDNLHISAGFYGLSCQKIYDNWQHWVWPEGSPDDVWILPDGLCADDLR